MIRTLPQFTNDNPPTLAEKQKYIESSGSGVTAAPASNTYTDETLKEATAQGLVWSPNTRAANGNMGAFVKGTN